MTKKPRGQRRFLIAALLLGMTLTILGGFFLGDYFYHRERFVPNSFIENFPVSDLTEPEAISEISTHSLLEIEKLPIIIKIEQDRFAFAPSELGLSIDPETSVRKAFERMRKVHFFRQLKIRAQRKPLIFPLYFKVNEVVLKTFLEHFQALVNRPPQNAAILFLQSGGYHLQAERTGRKLFLEESLQELEATLERGDREIHFKVEITQPRITKAHLKNYPPVHLLSSFTTFYGSHDSPNRIHNIQLIASWVGGTILLSGETFSLLDKTGDFTAERGFKEAYVILKGELVPQYGGGTCQIGTTLFNAVSLADLRVLKRRNHSFYFNIYPLGRDATVYPGQLDLLFENNTGHPILIAAKATKKSLNFKVYGTPTDKKVKFGPPSIYMLNSEGKFVPVSLKAVIKADRPFRTTVARSVYDGQGKLLHGEVLHSYYKLYGEKTNVPIQRREPR